MYQRLTPSSLRVAILERTELRLMRPDPLET